MVKFLIFFKIKDFIYSENFNNKNPGSLDLTEVELFIYFVPNLLTLFKTDERNEARELGAVFWCLH